MNLWEETHARCHPNTQSRAVLAPPKNWGDATEVTANSREIDADAVDQSPATLEDEEEVLDGIVDEQDYGEEYRNEAREAFKHSGFEAMAFYAPIHFYGPQNWGIYLHERCFYGLCSEIARTVGKAHWDVIVSEMRQVLDWHELFHAAVELFSLVLEDFANLGVGQFLGQLQGPVQASPICPYDQYFQNEYQQTWPTGRCVEESVATALQFQYPFTPRLGIGTAAKNLTRTAPDAYAFWTKYSKAQLFAKGVQEVTRKVIQAGYGKQYIAFQALAASGSRDNPGFSNSSLGDFWFPPLTKHSLRILYPVPRWVYRSGGLTTRRFSRAVLANKRMQDLLSALKRKYHVRIEPGGRHPRKIVLQNGRKIPVKSGNGVPNYLLSEIAKEIGISRKQLIDECF